MSPRPMITSRYEAGYSIVSLSGEFDLDTSDALREALYDHLDHGHPRHLIVDLTDVTFFDSTALGVVVGARNLATHNNVRLALAGASRVVGRVLSITQLDRAITTYPSLEAAVADFVRD